MLTCRGCLNLGPPPPHTKTLWHCGGRRADLKRCRVHGTSSRCARMKGRSGLRRSPIGRLCFVMSCWGYQGAPLRAAPLHPPGPLLGDHRHVAGRCPVARSRASASVLYFCNGEKPGGFVGAGGGAHGRPRPALRAAPHWNGQTYRSASRLRHAALPRDRTGGNLPLSTLLDACSAHEARGKAARIRDYVRPVWHHTRRNALLQRASAHTASSVRPLCVLGGSHWFAE